MYFAITLLEESRHICFVLNKQYFPSTIYRPAQNIYYVSVYVQLRALGTIIAGRGSIHYPPPPYILAELEAKPVPSKNLLHIIDWPNSSPDLKTFRQLCILQRIFFSQVGNCFQLFMSS